MIFFKSKTKEVKTSNIEETNWPALNWLIHVLSKDVGNVVWVRRTTEEQIKHDKENPHNKGYPFKVVRHPIPKGKKIILKDGGKTVIDCDSENTRNLIIQLAIEYNNLQFERDYYRNETHYDSWHKIEELPPHPMASSRPDSYHCLVYSPVLPYVNGGVTMGVRRRGKWYIIMKGQEIEHPVTHFRQLPPNPIKTVEYETVKEEAEKLRKILGYK